jgi:hypothetical protein
MAKFGPGFGCGSCCLSSYVISFHISDFNSLLNCTIGSISLANMITIKKMILFNFTVLFSIIVVVVVVEFILDFLCFLVL